MEEDIKYYLLALAHIDKTVAFLQEVKKQGDMKIYYDHLNFLKNLECRGAFMLAWRLRIFEKLKEQI